MKSRIAWTALIAFCASMATLLAVYLLAPAPPAPRQPSAAESGERIISRAELARHDDAASCWKAIDGVVYDVTAYLPRHPTEESVMLEWCGREATEAWRTKGVGRPHSRRAEAMLERYRIGRLAPRED